VKIMSKVSVVVPIYNARKTLDKCIKSILNQTFLEFELILVNDGSKDDSLSICQKYKKTDERIIVINKINEGCIASRRKGINASKSDYIMFVDADDWIDSKTIELLYNEAIHCSADITACNLYKVLGKSTLIKKKNDSRYFKGDKIYNREEIKNDLVVAYLHGHPFPSSLYAKLYKKDLLIDSGKYLKQINFMGEDLYYNLEIFLKANTVKVIDKHLYYYRAGGNTSKYMSYLFNDMIKGYEIQKEVIEEYYQNTKQKRYNGISVMALNTFKTCLSNLFTSKLNKPEIKELIKGYISNGSLIECLNNEYSVKYFPDEFLTAIKNKDVVYLFQLGQIMHKKNIPRKYLFKILSSFM
jgi:glycosyltransferase involved in cell wall biosynthesis